MKRLLHPVALGILALGARAELHHVRHATLAVNESAPHFVTAPNGVLLRARTLFDPAGSQLTVELTSIDPGGAVLWQRAISTGAPQVRERQMLVDSANGDVVLVLTSQSFNPSRVDLVLQRFDAAGNLRWSSTHATGHDLPLDACLGAAGEVLVVDAAGYPQSSAVPTPALLVCAGGVFQPPIALPGPNFADIEVEPHPAGGAVVAVIDRLALTITVQRFDSAGALVWSQTLANAGNVEALDPRRLAVDTAGNTFVATALRTSPSAWTPRITSYDASGAERWSFIHDHGAPGQQGYDSVAIDGAGNAVAIGRAWDVNHGIVRGLVGSCAPDGSLRWAHTLESSSIGLQPTILRLDRAGNAIVAGSELVGAVSQFLLVQFASDGEQRSRRLLRPPTGLPYSPLSLLETAPGELLYVAREIDDAIPTETPTIGRLRVQGTPYCLGDGSATPCPCGNASAFVDQAGCRHSGGSAAQLVDLGRASLANDGLVLRVRGARPIAPTTFVQGDLRSNGGAGVVFGDGLTCVAGSIVRLATITASGGSASIGAGFGASVSALGGITQPGVRVYQAVYRDAAPFCTPATLNATNGLEVIWIL